MDLGIVKEMDNDNLGRYKYLYEYKYEYMSNMSIFKYYIIPRIIILS